MSIKRTYVPTALCKDLYSDEMDPNSDHYDDIIADEFQRNFLCPNITDFQLFGDPLYLKNANGKALVVIVNSCTEAIKNDQDMLDLGLVNVTYTD